MKLRKSYTAAVAALLVTLQVADLGWMIATDLNLQDIVPVALFTTFAIYLLTLSVVSIGYTDVYVHWRFTVHMAALSTTSLAFLLIITILPYENAPKVPQRTIQYTSLTLLFVIFWLSMHTERGPKLHYPSSLIYSEKILSGTTTHVENNVNGITHASPWDALFFSYMMPVVMLGYAAERLGIGDLPILRADMRATTIFARMRTVMRAHRLTKLWLWKVKPGSGVQLAYQLIRANIRVLLIQVSLILVSAMVSYLPPFFLRSLVEYLEVDPGRLDSRWGWVYAGGLFASNATVYLGKFFIYF